MSKSATLIGKNVIEIEAQGLMAMKDRIDESFEKAAQLILSCQGKIVVTGIGKSGHIARKIASTFSSTGTPSVFLHPAESSHGDLGMISQGDVVIALSYGGGSPELIPVLNYAARKGNPIIAMTGSLKSNLANSAQVVLNVSVPKEACPLELAPTASSTATLAMGDALAMAVMEMRGFKASQFAENHPGGSLGFKLSRVFDNMHTGSGFILCPEDLPLRKVISSMSQTGTRGAAGILNQSGELIGVITDGDVRRRLENSTDPLAGVAREMMSSNPRMIDQEEIAEKALFMMEQFRINVLFVVNSKSESPRKPVGIIHIQDLLKNKVR